MMHHCEDSSSSASKDQVAGKTVAEILGEIVWLMTQDPRSKDMSINDIERIVMPAIILKQFHIEYVSTGSSKNKKNLIPIKATIFAMCSDSDMHLLMQGKLSEMQNNFWKSGNNKFEIAEYTMAGNKG